MTSLDCTNSVVNITNENYSFSINIPGHYQTEFVEKIFDYLNKSIKLASLELHVTEFRKRGDKIRIGDNEYKISDFDTQKNEILEELTKAKYNDHEDLVYRFQLTYVEIIDILDCKFFP